MGVYLRGKQFWIQFRYQGMRFREPVGPDRKLAEDVLAKRMVEIRENRFFPDKRKEPELVKFHDFAKEYLQWARTNKKASTYRGDLYRLRDLDREFEGRTIQEITSWQIEKYKMERAKDVKPATVNRELALIKQLFSKAVEWGRLKESPTGRKVKFLKGEEKRLRFLMPEDVQSVLSNCEDFLRPIVTVAVHTGMRRGEILNLMWDRTDVERGIITVIDTKNGERKDLPMDETVKALFRSLERKGELVFPNGKGKPFSPVTVHRAFHRALDCSGIADFHFHDLRHTYASNLVMAGVKLEVVQKLMGHKMIAMTQRYAHLAPEYLADGVRKLDEWIGAATKLPHAGRGG